MLADGMFLGCAFRYRVYHLALQVDRVSTCPWSAYLLFAFQVEGNLDCASAIAGREYLACMGVMFSCLFGTVRSRTFAHVRLISQSNLCACG